MKMQVQMKEVMAATTAMMERLPEEALVRRLKPLKTRLAASFTWRIL